MSRLKRQARVMEHVEAQQRGAFFDKLPPRPKRTLAQSLRWELLKLADGCADFTDHVETGWASVTFEGTRHVIRMTISDPVALGRFLSELPEHQFHIPGQLVADVSARCDGGEVVVTIIALREAL